MENKYVCSVDIGGTKIATAIMEYPADGSVPHPVFEAEVPTEAQEGGEAVFLFEEVEDDVVRPAGDDRRGAAPPADRPLSDRGSPSGRYRNSGAQTTARVRCALPS